MPTGSDALLDELLGLARAVAERAAQLALDSLETVRSINSKSSPTDLVTEVDTAVEALIIDRLLSTRPDDGVLGEEGSDLAGSSGVRWVIDPIDGTTNYVYRHPGWGVSIAAEVDGQSVVGVVVDPMRGDRFTAARGRGAQLNDRPIMVSGSDQLASALIATGFGYDAARRRQQAAVVTDLIAEIRDIRRVGAAALDLCAVACGRVDGYYEVGLSPWDLAAGLVIATEAGAVSGAIEGGPARPDSVVVTTPDIFAPLMAALGRAGGAELVE